MGSINKKLSVITVTMNSANDLAKTIESVSNQKFRENIEYLIIDGQSSDESLTLLEKNRQRIDVTISSRDRGVYDAMNKGLDKCTCDWVYFLNAGDVFLNENSVTKILQELEINDVLYSDVLVTNGTDNYRFVTSFDDRKLNHQGFVYRKTLHDQFGKYAVIKGFSAADYLFFLQLNDLRIKKLNEPVAIFQAGGLSSTIKAVRQKYCLDFLSGKISALSLAFRLIVYPIYRTIKKITR